MVWRGCTEVPSRFATGHPKLTRLLHQQSQFVGLTPFFDALVDYQASLIVMCIFVRQSVQNTINNQHADRDVGSLSTGVQLGHNLQLTLREVNCIDRFAFEAWLVVPVASI